MKSFFSIVLIVIATVHLSAQIPVTSTTDTMGDYPYFFYNYWPEHTDNMHNGIYCQRRVDDFFGDYASGSVWRSSLVCDEYAIEMFATDTIHVTGIACSETNVGITRIRIYDSTMTTIWEVEDTISQYAPGAASDTSFHLIYLSDYPWPPNWMKFFYLYKGKSHITLYGKFYLGFASYCPAYGTYCASDCPKQYFEDHDPPYLFPKIEYRKLIDGVWSSGDSTRGIPLAFPIIVPQCNDDLTGLSVTHVGDTALTVSWDTAGLRGIPAGRIDPAVDLWLGPRDSMPDSTGTVRLRLPPWHRDSLQPGSYDLYARKVCNPQYDITTDWRLIDSFSIAAPLPPPDTTVNPPDTTGINTPEFRIPNSIFTIHPNPARGTVTVTTAAQQGTLTIIDLQGREVYTQAIRQSGNQAITVDIRSLPAGTYIVTLLTPQGHSSQKLTVE